MNFFIFSHVLFLIRGETVTSAKLFLTAILCFHVGTSQAGEEWKEVQTVLVNPVQLYPLIVIDN